MKVVTRMRIRQNPAMKRKRVSIEDIDKYRSMASIAPVVLLLAVFMVIPIFILLYHGFTKWDGLHSKFIGFDNYLSLAKSSEFWLLLRNNFIVALSVPLQIVICLVITLLLYEKVAGWKFFRGAFFFPYVFSTVVIGFLFRVFFGFNGPLNAVLRMMKLDILAQDWLAQSGTAMGVVIFCIIWAGFGTGVLIFLAGMSSIHMSIFECSRLDGANWFQRLFYIVFPLLMPSIEFYTVTSLIATFTGMFGLIFSLTNGGPGYETTTIEYMIYLKAFIGNEMGYASAIAAILLVLLIGLTRFQFKIMNGEEDRGA